MLQKGYAGHTQERESQTGILPERAGGLK
jgi:hypothetical protein